MSIAGRSKGRRILRKLSGKLPASSASVWLPFALIGAIAMFIVLVFGSGDSFLMWLWPICVVCGVALEALGDFLLRRGRWVSGDLSRIFGLFTMNLGMVLFIAWAWASGEDAWFWYATLIYGALVVFLVGWSVDDWRGNRLR
ncbi:MAG: hypothetical protein ACRDSJ_00375 [Rubrobacteraceae bacterium]